MTRVIKIEKNGGPEVLQIKNVELQEPYYSYVEASQKREELSKKN